MEEVEEGKRGAVGNTGSTPGGNNAPRGPLGELSHVDDDSLRRALEVLALLPTFGAQRSRQAKALLLSATAAHGFSESSELPGSGTAAATRLPGMQTLRRDMRAASVGTLASGRNERSRTPPPGVGHPQLASHRSSSLSTASVGAVSFASA